MKKLILLLALLPSIAFSQVMFTIPINVPCGDTKVILEKLSVNYAEKIEFVGTDEDKKLYSLWVNEKEKTFTILISANGGKVSCIIGAGSIPEKS